MRWKDLTKRKAKPSIERSSFEGICRMKRPKTINQVRREKLDNHYAEALSKARNKETLDRVIMSILKHHRMDRTRARYKKYLSVINKNGAKDKPYREYD